MAKTKLIILNLILLTLGILLVVGPADFDFFSEHVFILVGMLFIFSAGWIASGINSEVIS
jgi:hypothetical protein